MTAKTKRRRPDEGPAHQTFPSVSTGDPAIARGAAIEIARILDDDKCDDIVVLDVSKLSQVSDYLVLASGTSDRQMRSAGDDAAEIAASHGFPAYRRSVDDRTTWIVLDCIDVVVHVFEPNTRAHYDLEMLWGDAERVAWERPAGQRDRASVRRGA